MQVHAPPPLLAQRALSQRCQKCCFARKAGVESRDGDK